MKKRWIFIPLCILLVLLFGGKIAFEKGRDYVTKKMVTSLAETEEIKKYEEKAEKLTEDIKPEETVASNEEKYNDKKSEKTSEVKDFWSEPLVREVYGRFSASEVSTCSNMLSGGLTKEEKKYIKNLVYSRVSSAEISEIERLYYKYN